MKILPNLPLAALGIAASVASACADDRQVTVYTGAGGISLPASALAAPVPARRTTRDGAAHGIRIVLDPPSRATN